MPPEPTVGPTFDLLEFPGFSGPLGGQGQHDSRDCFRKGSKKGSYKVSCSGAFRAEGF